MLYRAKWFHRAKFRTLGFVFVLLMICLPLACDETSASENNFVEELPSHPVTVSVVGLLGTLELVNQNQERLSITEDGEYSFESAVTEGETYSVSVSSQPLSQTCEVLEAEGVMSPSMAPLSVLCAYTVAERVPLLRIQTDGEQPITSKEEYFSGVYEFEAEDGTVKNAGTLLIRGRGNSTWNYPKKPFRLKLTTSAPLGGMPASRHWVLLANYLDKSLLRTEIALEFARLMGMAWAPRSVQVEVELNGVYAGLYQLTEHVRIDRDRVDIDELEGDESDPEDLTGGYLLEVDYNEGEAYCHHTPNGCVFCFKDPEELLEPGWEEHKAYIDDFLDRADQALYGESFTDPVTGYAAYIDVDSAVDFYLVHELTKNPDSNFFSSIYLYKPRGEEKLYFGPVWDFDLSIGNAQWAWSGWFDGTTSAGWHTRNQDSRVDDPVTNWYTRLFEDPAFQAKVSTRWEELYDSGVFDTLLEYLSIRQAHLSFVQEENFNRWNVLNTVLQPDLSPLRGSYNDHVAGLRMFLRSRIEWMNTSLRQ